jgi:acetyl-CoA carboxylase carboxyl transferase subunit beta
MDVRYKSPTGKIIDADERNLFVSPEDGFHVRIGSDTYFEILFDNNEFVELDKNLTSKILCALLTKYADRLKDVMGKPNLKTQCVLELENLKVKN